MPSPLGHALGGIIAGWTIAGRASSCRTSSGAAQHTPPDGPRRWIADAWPYAILGVLPDLDLLFGTHSTYSHSTGAVLGITLLAALTSRQWRRHPPNGRLRAVAMMAIGAAYASHLLLDWLGTDTSPPVGIMALWPFTTAFYKAPVTWFPPVSRQVSSPEFWSSLSTAVTVELGVLGSLALLVGWLRRSWLVARGS